MAPPRPYLWHGDDGSRSFAYAKTGMTRVGGRRALDPPCRRRIGQALDQGGQALAVGLAQAVPVGVVVLDGDEFGGEAVGAIGDEVDGRGDGEVGADGGVEGQQGQLGGLVQRAPGVEGTVEDRLAVFGLADLQEGRAGRTPPRNCRPRRSGRGVAARRRSGPRPGSCPPDRRSVPRTWRRRRSCCAGWAPTIPATSNIVRGRLRSWAGSPEPAPSSRVVTTAWVVARFAGGLDDDHPVLGGLHQVQLRDADHLIDTRVGAGVGRQNQTLGQQDAEAVGHGAA